MSRTVITSELYLQSYHNTLLPTIARGTIMQKNKQEDAEYPYEHGCYESTYPTVSTEEGWRERGRSLYQSFQSYQRIRKCQIILGTYVML